MFIYLVTKEDASFVRVTVLKYVLHISWLMETRLCLQIRQRVSDPIYFKLILAWDYFAKGKSN